MQTCILLTLYICVWNFGSMTSETNEIMTIFLNMPVYLYFFQHLLSFGFVSVFDCQSSSDEYASNIIARNQQKREQKKALHEEKKLRKKQIKKQKKREKLKQTLPNLDVINNMEEILCNNESIFNV